MLNLPKRFVLFGVKCTTWEGATARNWSGPGEYRELIQLAAAFVDAKNLIELSSFQTLVKPRKNQILSQYFVNLTHITQEMVDKEGLDFASVLTDFHMWCEDIDLYCFDSRVDGSRLFDRDVLVENCDLYGLEFPFDPEKFHNINETFAQHGYLIKQSGAAPEAFGIKIPARPHDAMNDVNGVLVALKALDRILDLRNRLDSPLKID